MRHPGHGADLAEPPLRRGAQRRVGDGERGQQYEHAQVRRESAQVRGEPAGPAGLVHDEADASSSAQLASTAVIRGGSTKEASSGPTASHGTRMRALPMAYCATATAVMARNSSSANTR